MFSKYGLEYCLISSLTVTFIECRLGLKGHGLNGDKSDTIDAGSKVTSRLAIDVDRTRDTTEKDDLGSAYRRETIYTFPLIDLICKSRTTFRMY